MWEDGHLEWNAYTGYKRSYRAVATGHAPTSTAPGWCTALPDDNTSVFPWAKKAYKVYHIDSLPEI